MTNTHAARLEAARRAHPDFASLSPAERAAACAAASIDSTPDEANDPPACCAGIVGTCPCSCHDYDAADVPAPIAAGRMAAGSALARVELAGSSAVRGGTCRNCGEGPGIAVRDHRVILEGWVLEVTLCEPCGVGFVRDVTA